MLKIQALPTLSVTVVDHMGQEVTLLFTKVSRSDWQTEAKFKPWTRYFNRAAMLLGFLNPQNFQATSFMKRTIVFESAKLKLNNESRFQDN